MVDVIRTVSDTQQYLELFKFFDLCLQIIYI